MELEALECGVSKPRQLVLGEDRTPGIAPRPAGGRLFIPKRPGEYVMEGGKRNGRSTLIRPLCTMELEVVRLEAGDARLAVRAADVPSLWPQ